MRSWKMFAFTLAVALGFAATAVAQPQPSTPAAAAGRTRPMERVLQEAAVERETARTGAGLLEATMRNMPSWPSRCADLLKELKGVLSEEQYNKVKEHLERMPPGPPEPPRGRRPEGREGPGDRPGRPGPGGREVPAIVPVECARGTARRGGPGGVEGRRGPGGPGGMERVLADLKLSDKQIEEAHKVLKANRERLLKEMREVLSEEQYNRFKERLENRRPPHAPPGATAAEVEQNRAATVRERLEYRSHHLLWAGSLTGPRNPTEGSLGCGWGVGDLRFRARGLVRKPSHNRAPQQGNRGRRGA